MIQKALEISIQETRPPLTRINLQSKKRRDKLEQHRGGLEYRGCGKNHVHTL